MSTLPAQAARPAFNRRRPPADSDSFREQELHKVRFLFSPLLFIDTRYDQAGFNEIKPGDISVVDVYRMKIPNTKRIQEGTSSTEPEQVWHSRLPGVIANRILSNNTHDDGTPTGFCELNELRGLNPSESQEAEELIADLQATLWPVSYRTGREQLEYLNGVGLQSDPLYEATRQRMIEAVTTAMAYADIHYMNLVDELSQRAAGGEGAKGRRNKADAEDMRICAYIEREVPILASPLVQNRVEEIIKKQQAEVKPAIPQVQCLNCGAMSNLIVATGKPPKLCAGCGNEFPVEEVINEPLSRVSDAEEFGEMTGDKKKVKK